MNDSLVVVTACDDKYALGAAVAVRSAIDSLPADRSVRVFVLDGGISPRSKRRLHRSWSSQRTSVDWLAPDRKLIDSLPVSHYVSRSTYLRLLQAELLPADVTKAIFLDADMVVTRDLTELWSQSLDGAYCAAVQDPYVPVLNPADAYDHPLHCMVVPGMDPLPVPNYRELGLRGDSAYFNAGLMLVNVARWREESIACRALECLHVNAAHVRFWDQYALNVLFSGQWKLLDPRWNQTSHVYWFPSWESSHYTRDELEQLRRDPWIVHFNFLPKPWDLVCDHPFRELFFEHLDHTDWRGWRPRLTLQNRMQSAYGVYQTWRRQHVAPVVRYWKQQLLSRRSAA